MDYNNLCLGSEMLGRYPDVRGGSVLCRECGAWVKTPFTDTALVPVHEWPVSREDEVRAQRNAASIIRREYENARRNGTLISDPYRWHSTALEMARGTRYA